MEIDEAKKCMAERIPVIIRNSYYFYNTPTYITKIYENVSVTNVKVEGSNDHYEIWRVEKYVNELNKFIGRIKNTLESISPEALGNFYKKELLSQMDEIKIDIDEVLEDLSYAMKENNKEEIESLKNEIKELMDELVEIENDFKEIQESLKYIE